MRSIFLLIPCFFYTLILFGQKSIPSDSVTVLPEVLLLEEKKVKQTEGIIPSQIIGEKIFDNFSPVDAVSAINQIPGVYILSGALNTNRITIRGIGARTLFGTDKLRLYYDEIPVTNGSGFSSIEAFDLENFSQVEVVKGPKATTFGTNLGGAILLSTREGLGQGTRFSNHTTFGSYNLFKNNLAFSQTDERLKVNLNYEHLETDGYRENNRFERDGLLLRTSYSLNDRNEIGILVNYVDYIAQIPSSLGITAFEEDPTQAAFTWAASKGFEDNRYTLVGLNYTHRFSSNFRNTSSIFYSYLDHYEARPFGILDEYTNGFGLRTHFKGSTNLFERKTEYSFGTELYKDEYTWREFENDYQDNAGEGSLQGDLFADNREFRAQINAFGTLNTEVFNHLNLQLGLNINHTQYDFRDRFNPGDANRSAARDFRTIALPSINLSYRFSDYQTLYANISRGFSNPTVEETLTPEGVINPDIEQEKGVNYEIGSQLFLLDSKLHILLTLYQMDVKNLLVAERVGDDQFVGRNAGKTRHRGLEVALNYRWVLGSDWELMPFVNYTFSDHQFVDFVDGDDDFSGNPLTGVPRHRFNSGVQFRYGNRFFWNTTHQYVGSIPLTDANTLFSDPFHLFGTKWRYEKNLSNRFGLGLSFGINNLFNVRYAQSVLINTNAFGGAEPRYYYPGNARNVYGSIRLRYSL
ncbi:TonB-dependent receptor family protein [Muriicola jejuensis]|uniref:TonB-dependent receptor n=1 Tax=Muriicola jejuensis TaxID=504488 RepID=A0A6P0UEP0_9FLAO|nr:TonB-dependent receptor [Muriicola jejuensis]NER10208.1 TonB-dependent receptor [Muriicola jejuensis]